MDLCNESCSSGRPDDDDDDDGDGDVDIERRCINSKRHPVH